MKEKDIYYPNDTYDRYCSYIKQAKDKNFLSVIERCNSTNTKFISSKFYRDRNFKELYYSYDRKYITEGYYIDNVIEDSVCGTENYKSRIYESNTNENWEKEKWFRDNNFTDLLVSTYKYVNANGNKEQQTVNENDQGGWYSTMFENDIHDRIIKQYWYVDKEFNDLYQEQYWEYQDDNNYSHTTILHRPLKNNEYHNIKFYSNGKLYKEFYYKDKELTKLVATETYEYLLNNKSIRKTIFEEVAHYVNIYSSIDYFNKDGKPTYCLAYTDNDFENLYRKSWWKYSKKYQFVLRIYKNTQANYNTEIEKYDYNKNLIYKKQYKTNYFIGRLLLFIAH